MKKAKFKIFAVLLSLLLSSCASDSSIFPVLPTTTDPTAVKLPNPIAIAVDEANSQIVVVNSNVDIFYNQGSIAVIEIDATNTNAPTLTAQAILATPNFGGAIAFDGTNAYVPYREGTDASSNTDQIIHYTVGNDSITQTTTASTSKEPYGIALNAGSLYVVSNEKLDIFDTSLNATTNVDLTSAEDADIENSLSENVENIAIDTVGNRAFLTNRNSNILVVDLDNNTLTHTLDGPTNTRGIAYDGSRLLVVDGSPASLWVLDPTQLSDPNSGISQIDDSSLVLEVLDLGFNPNGIVVDTANNKAYVANTTERTISVIDLNLLVEVTRISLKGSDSGFDDGRDPFGLAIGTFNAVPFVFVANLGSNNITVINGQTNKVVASYP